MRSLAVLLLTMTTTAAADPRPMSAGAAPVPTTSTTIVLAREELTIDVGMRAATVRAVLHLVDHGDGGKLTVGFPCEPDAAKEVATLTCKTRPTVTADGKKIAVRLEKRNWVWPMSFPAGKEVELVVAYQAPLVNDRYETPFDGLGLLHYRLTTGAAWAGPIGQLDMEVRLPTDAVVSITPAGYGRASPGTITWSFKDYEPADDVAVVVHPMFAGRYAHILRATKRDDLAARIARGDFDGDALADLAGEMRKESDEAIHFAHWFQGQIARPLGLSDPPDAAVRATLAESLRLIEDTAARGRHGKRTGSGVTKGP